MTRKPKRMTNADTAAHPSKRTYRPRSPHRIGSTAMANISTQGAKTFSERLLARRSELGVTQIEVADEAGFSRPAMHSYENGLEPSIEKVFRLAEVLDVTPEWLAFGIGARGGIQHLRYEDGEQHKEGIWNFNQDWLDNNFGEGLTLALVEVTNAGTFLNPKDLALVLIGARPTVANDEFVCKIDDDVIVARVTRQRDGKYRVFENETSYQTLSEKEVEFIGKIVGGVVKA